MMGMGWYFRIFWKLFGALNGAKNKWFERQFEPQEPKARRFKP